LKKMNSSTLPASRGRFTVAVLSLAQALAMTGVSIVTLSTGLAGTYLSASPTLATAPLAVQFLATMLATFPAAMFMRRYGRRLGFSLGQFIGLLGALFSVFALMEKSFLMFMVAGAVLGVHNAFWGYYRFAAAEAAEVGFKNRAISLVMAGGVLAAVAGPELAKHTRDLFEPIVFAGCYAVIAVLCAVNMIVLQFASLPGAPAVKVPPGGRTWIELLRQPKFFAAVAAAMAGYGVMILVMAATPLSMADCGLEFNDAAFVIQWHGLAMFAPSFFTGSFIQRWGAFRIVLVGLVLNVVCMAANLAGTNLANFWFGLVALGLGWNFMYVGATSLLTESYRPEDRDTAQATNDTLVFASIALATFASGALQNTWGWTAVNAVIALPLILALMALMGLRRAPQPAL
jgi:predicted MFS family arabinose efflux permease